ncbi:MAG: tetratricopeptide repeat protein [bacterium]|nr:tetratricopeptide repeat protein [bacterium]
MKKTIGLLCCIAILFFAHQGHSEKSSDKSEDLRRGREFLSKGMYKYSASILREACREDKSADCWNHLGVAYMGLKQYPTALELFKKAAKKERLSRFVSNMGLAYYYLKDRENAMKNYRDAVALDHKNYSARINLAVLHVRNGDPAKGEKQLRKILKEKSDLFYARLHLGQVLYSKKKYSNALVQFSKGIEVTKKSYRLYLYRAYTYFRLRNYYAAEMDLAQVDILKTGDRKAMILRTMIQRKKGYSW